MLRAIGLFFVLALMWWLWSGHATPMLLGFGFFSCLLVVFIASRMDVIDREATPMHLTARVPFYWSWLCKEMFLSSIDCCKRILRPGKFVSPVVADVAADQETDLGKVTYANSITLTPGTLTMELDKNKITVHALDQSLIDALNTGEMANRVNRLG